LNETPRARSRWAELDRASWPELRDRVLGHAPGSSPPEPRAYPGYPKWPLPKVRNRALAGLDHTLTTRRSAQTLGTELPSARTIARILLKAHGVCADRSRGPAPSAGGLQAQELYMVALSAGWLPAGVYHYDRAGHSLSQIVDTAERERWLELIPSTNAVRGGALLWILVADRQRVSDKYGDRSDRLLLLEAGHLMQNLCLLSASQGLCTVPQGGSLEHEIARELLLPGGDVVLYTGVCGTQVRSDSGS
jgi:SagB-type dehydrogenase family enzyme